MQWITTDRESRRRVRLSAGLLCRLAALAAALYSAMLSALEADDPAWRDFQHALGEPALIGANAGHPMADEPWRPIPQTSPLEVDPLKFELGSDLFHEGRLSSGNAIACVTCHAGALSGADRRRVSIGVAGARGTMNALSVFNAAFNFRQFWDGRAVTLADQALEPIQNEVEMAHTLKAVEQMLRSDPEYVERFEAVYPDGVTIDNMTDAIAHFQRINFVRLDTPFQRQLNGEDALDEQEQRGWRRFDEIGCTACHNGINLGGNSYQRLGAAVPYYQGGLESRVGPDEQQPESDAHDLGLMARSGRERDRHVFKVPGLHGVATTPPYFHDGSVATLEEAIVEMAEHQLGRTLGQQDIDDIEAFLRALGGPFSGSTTPAPDDSDDSQRPRDDQASGPGSGSHREAYLAAIDAVAKAASQLAPEMQRIQAGEVAHYDFLQFQHRELIRHARALHHPPSSLPGSARSALISSARDLLGHVDTLEWMIADFLRGDAMLRVLNAGHRQRAYR